MCRFTQEGFHEHAIRVFPYLISYKRKAARHFENGLELKLNHYVPPKPKVMKISRIWSLMGFTENFLTLDY